MFHLFRMSRAGKCIQHNSPSLHGKNLETARLFRAPRGQRKRKVADPRGGGAVPKALGGLLCPSECWHLQKCCEGSPALVGLHSARFPGPLRKFLLDPGCDPQCPGLLPAPTMSPWCCCLPTKSSPAFYGSPVWETSHVQNRGLKTCGEKAGREKGKEEFSQE